jgi:hypothetical protein
MSKKRGKESMNSELRAACIRAIQQAKKPMTVVEIGAACLIRGKPTEKLAGPLDELSASALIHEWPKYRNTRIFWNRPLRSAVDEAFIAVLDSAPLTVPKAAKPVSKLLQRASESSVLSELKLVAPRLAATHRIMHVAVNRQSVVYLSFAYVGRLLPGRGPETSIETTVVEAVKRLQSGPGNFVRIDHLRNAPELRGILDATVIRLAEKGELVLGRYDGPRPVPEEDKWNYVEDERAELFIGAAVPRGKRVIA